MCWSGKGHPAPVAGLADVTAIAVGSRSCAVLASGRLRCWDSGSAPAPVSGIEDAIAVGVTEDTACALRRSGAVACFGANAAGEVGDGSREKRDHPVEVAGIRDAVSLSMGNGRTCVALRTGRVSCWGLGFAATEMGAMMPPGEWKGSLTPERIPEIEDAVEVATGLEYGCARRRSGGLVCWGGFPSLRAAGGAPNRPHPIDGVEGAVQTSAGTFHACAALATGKIVCIGSNREGALGRDPKNRSETPLRLPGVAGVRAVSLNGWGVCAVTQSDTALCWSHDPTLDSAEELKRAGGAVGEVAARTQAGIAHVTLGVGEIQCLARKEGTVSCSSRDEGTADVPGLTDAVEVAAGADFACARRKAGAVACWGLGTLAKVPAPVPGLADASEVVAFGSRACAVRRSGKVSCWGDNRRGEVGDGPRETIVRPIDVKGIDDASHVALASFSCALRRSGKISCWGPEAPTAQDVAPLTGATSIAIRWSRVCAVLPGGTRRCSSSGEVPGLHDAVALYASSGTICARTTDGSLACWGDNGHGQLGVVPFEFSDRAVPIDLASTGRPASR